MDSIRKTHRIAIVTDDSSRTNLIEWSYFNRKILSPHEIIANEFTADLLQGTLDKSVKGVPSTSSDGYYELLQLIETKSIDILLFFGDPLKTETRQTAISELLIRAFEQNIITACNVATADLVIGSLRAAGTKNPRDKNKTVINHEPASDAEHNQDIPFLQKAAGHSM